MKHVLSALVIILLSGPIWSTAKQGNPQAKLTDLEFFTCVSAYNLVWAENVCLKQELAD